MRLATVFKKEMREGVRDRRSLLTALFFPMLGPLGIWAALTQVVDTVSEPGAAKVAVIRGEEAPALLAWLDQRNVDIVELPHPEEALLRGEASVVLRFSDQFAEDLRAGRPAVVELLNDGSRKEDSAARRRVGRLLESWSNQTAAMRLMARGVSPTAIVPLVVDEVDTATPERRAGPFLEMVGMMVVLAAFFCNMYVAIDTTAGERERRSMEPLLLTSVPRIVIATGKWLAGSIFGGAGVALTVAAIGALLGSVPLEVLGARVDIGPTMMLRLFGVMIPLIGFAAALQMLVCSFARSFKEAQTLVTLTSLVGVAPGMWATFQPIASVPWKYAVPVLSQHLLSGAVTRGEAIPAIHHVLSISTTLAATGICLLGVVHMFRSEGFLRG